MKYSFASVYSLINVLIYNWYFFISSFILFWASFCSCNFKSFFGLFWLFKGIFWLFSVLSFNCFCWAYFGSTTFFITYICLPVFGSVTKTFCCIICWFLLLSIGALLWFWLDNWAFCCFKAISYLGSITFFITYIFFPVFGSVTNTFCCIIYCLGIWLIGIFLLLFPVLFFSFGSLSCGIFFGKELLGFIVVLEPLSFCFWIFDFWLFFGSWIFDSTWLSSIFCVNSLLITLILCSILLFISANSWGFDILSLSVNFKIFFS